MGLFGKKKEEEIPELPDLPSIDSGLPELPSDFPVASPPGLQGVEVNELPSLPSEVGGFGGSAIKQAIEHPGMRKSIMSRPEPIRAEPVPMISEPAFDSSMKRTKSVEPIYVRLDKFQTTVEAFEDIRKKIMEIEGVLSKIKEIKSQEERELEEWEQEIQSIKARIEHIDKSVFNKLD